MISSIIHGSIFVWQVKTKCETWYEYNIEGEGRESGCDKGTRGRHHVEVVMLLKTLHT